MQRHRRGQCSATAVLLAGSVSKDQIRGHTAGEQQRERKEKREERGRVPGTAQPYVIHTEPASHAAVTAAGLSECCPAAAVAAAAAASPASFCFRSAHLFFW